MRDVTETISWSLIPGITSQDSTIEGWFVRKMSKVLSFLVGLWTNCENP